MWRSIQSVIGNKFTRTRAPDWLAKSIAALLILPLLTPSMITQGTAQTKRLLITEIMYDLPGADSKREWVEIYNAGSTDIDLTGWRFNDGSNHLLTIHHNPHQADTLVIPSGSLAVIADDPAGFLVDQVGYQGMLIDTAMALPNAAAALSLIDPDGTVVDSVSYESSWGASGDGNSLEKINPTGPNAPDNWRVSLVIGGTPGQLPVTAENPESPDPEDAEGSEPEEDSEETEETPDEVEDPAEPPAETEEESTPPEEETPADQPDTDLLPPYLNEFLPAPGNTIDWNGNGVADSNDEWIEIFNPNNTPIDLGNWQLDDIPDGGSAPFTLPTETIIAAKGYLVIHKQHVPPASGLILNNTTDSVLLIDPVGTIVDRYNYTSTQADHSYARDPISQQWVETGMPTPGAANQVATPDEPDEVEDPAEPPTETEPDEEPQEDPTPPEETNEETPVDQPDTSLLPPYLNEFLPAPGSTTDWNGDGTANSHDEWIEIFNPNDAPIDLGNWQLDDISDGGSAPFTLPAETIIAAKGYLVIHKQHIPPASGLILNNTTDSVLLIDPVGTIVDRYDYTSTQTDHSYARDPVTQHWVEAATPTPGAANQVDGQTPPGNDPDVNDSDTDNATEEEENLESPDQQDALPQPESVATFHLNEYLPHPGTAVDWNEDGKADTYDEFIELYNAGTEAIDLSLWQLDDVADGGSNPFVFPDGTTLAEQSYLVIFRKVSNASAQESALQSGLTLNNDNDCVRLLQPNGTEWDKHCYESAKLGIALARHPDNTDQWVETATPTPGTKNEVAGTVAGEQDSLLELQSIADAKGLGTDAAVHVSGQLTVLPNRVGNNRLYLQDATAGIAVELTGTFPELTLGDKIRVVGTLQTRYGEQYIKAESGDFEIVVSGLTPPAPLNLKVNQIGEEQVGQLLTVSGSVDKVSGTTYFVNDGSGTLRIVVNEHAALKKPTLRKGMSVSITGILGRYHTASSSDEGFRLLPREQSDIHSSLAPTGRFSLRQKLASIFCRIAKRHDRFQSRCDAYSQQ